MPGTLPAEAGGPNAQAASTPAATAVGQSPLASAPLAVPAPAAAAQNDAAFGFQPSHAPALDPAVAQIAGTAMIQHDQRFASLAPAAPAMTFSSTPAAVVSFPAQTLALDEKGIAQVQAAVTAFKAKGGYVRVVGHSASGAPGLSPDRQLMQSFDRSQACATAVARELIRQGVPASHVLVDAESTLAADEQRRAEIFLQS